MAAYQSTPAAADGNPERAGWPWTRMALGVGAHVLVSLVVAGMTRAEIGQELTTSWLWLLSAVVALCGPLLGAAVAAWNRPDGPLVGAVTAFGGAVVLAVITVVRRTSTAQGLPLPSLLAVAAIQVAIGLGAGVVTRHFTYTGERGGS